MEAEFINTLPPKGNGIDSNAGLLSQILKIPELSRYSPPDAQRIAAAHAASRRG